jgi:hypothetical protein
VIAQADIARCAAEDRTGEVVREVSQPTRMASAVR